MHPFLNRIIIILSLLYSLLNFDIRFHAFFVLFKSIFLLYHAFFSNSFNDLSSSYAF